MSKLNHIKKNLAEKITKNKIFETLLDYLRVKSHLEQSKIYAKSNKILQN